MSEVKMIRRNTAIAVMVMIIIFILSMVTCFIWFGPHAAIENSARDIRNNYSFEHNESFEYRLGFWSGVEYMRWYLNDRFDSDVTIKQIFDRSWDTK